jgi:hypothetical protein
MSTKETPLTRRYWERVVGRGTLLEEYCVVRPRPGVSPRYIDGVIILGGEHRIASKPEHGSLNGHDVVVVQTKRGRLGMYLLGQSTKSLRSSPLRGARGERSVAS